MKYKQCSQCKAKKDVTEYNKREKSADGLNSWCRVCTKKAQKAYKLKVKQKKLEEDLYGTSNIKIQPRKKYTLKIPKSDPNSRFMKSRLKKIKASYYKVLEKRRKREAAEDRYINSLDSCSIETDSNLFDNSLRYVDIFSIAEY